MATARHKKGGLSLQNDVLVMETRLKLLKEQMDNERKKREDMVKKNGTGSIWMNGRSGTIRGLREVRAMVRTNARERAVRPASATSAADTETTSPTHLDEAPVGNDRPWTPAEHGNGELSCGPDEPPAPQARPGTAPPVQVAAMECQTEPMLTDRPRWSTKCGSAKENMKPSTGTKRAVTQTYLQKILAARKQQQQQ